MIVSGGELVLADTSPTFARLSYYPTRGLALAGGQFASYSTLYKQLWVSTVVDKRATAVARLPLKVYRRATEGREDARDTPYGQLIRRPSTRLDPFLFWRWVSSTYDVNGEAMLVKVRDAAGVPVELLPLHPANVNVRVVDGEPVYVFTSGGSVIDAPQIVIPRRDVVHFKNFNPDTLLRGMSKLEVLRRTLENEDAARRASSALWRNGGRPAGFLSHPNKLGDDALRRLRGQWDDIHGGVDNFAKWAILEEGMEPKQLSLSAEELQYIETRKLNREEVCAAYDVPPPVVHILDRATFSNITEQMRSLYRDTMAPHLGALESTLDHELRPDFDDTGALYAEFLMDEVLRGSFEARQEAYQRADYMTVAEKRRAENLPFVEGSDVILVNGAYVPLDMAGRTHQTEPLADQEPASEPVPPVRAISADVAATVTKRVGRRPTLFALDVDALTSGLGGDAVPVMRMLEESLVRGELPRDFIRRVWGIVGEPSEVAQLTAAVVASLDRKAPEVNVTVNPPEVRVPDVRVDAPVTVNVPESAPRTKTIERDGDGEITRIVEA